MLQVGCGSVGLTRVCPSRTAAPNSNTENLRRIPFVIIFTSLLLFRPHHALTGFGNRSNTFEIETLDTCSAVGFRCVEVAFGIGIQVVHSEELTWLPAAVTK